VGGASTNDAEKLYEIGRLIGIGFQLQDDLLDTFGNVETFGKKIGGDISENKKTFLVIKALELLTPAQKQELLHVYANKQFEGKYNKVVELFNAVEIQSVTKAYIADYFTKALAILDSLSLDSEKKQELYVFIKELQDRSF